MKKLHKLVIPTTIGDEYITKEKALDLLNTFSPFDELEEYEGVYLSESGELIHETSILVETTATAMEICNLFKQECVLEIIGVHAQLVFSSGQKKIFKNKVEVSFETSEQKVALLMQLAKQYGGASAVCGETRIFSYVE